MICRQSNISAIVRLATKMYATLYSQQHTSWCSASAMCWSAFQPNLFGIGDQCRILSTYITKFPLKLYLIKNDGSQLHEKPFYLGVIENVYFINLMNL